VVHGPGVPSGALPLHERSAHLVAEEDDELRSALSNSLRQDGYLVLEAHDVPSVLGIARVHSRPIHLLLIDVSIDNHTLAALRKPYRPEM
jgi:DNA-binding response OmpR family regulator